MTQQNVKRTALICGISGQDGMGVQGLNVSGAGIRVEVNLGANA